MGKNTEGPGGVPREGRENEGNYHVTARPINRLEKEKKIVDA